MAKQSKARITPASHSRLIEFLRQHYWKDPGSAPLLRQLADGEARWEDFLLEHGRFWHWSPVAGIDRSPAANSPPFIRPLPTSWCHANSLHLALCDGRLTYVEGIAVVGREVPALHAWTVDSGGHVIDATWHPLQKGKRKRTYFGIPFCGNRLMAQFARVSHGPLAKWTSLSEQYKVLTDLRRNPRRWVCTQNQGSTVRHNQDQFIRQQDSELVKCLAILADKGFRGKARDMLQSLHQIRRKRNHRRQDCDIGDVTPSRFAHYLSNLRLALAQVGIGLERNHSGIWSLERCTPMGPLSHQTWRSLAPGTVGLASSL